ncbi:SOS response-associated peptidase [Aestuariivirga sp.]|uniref:SOS response-associated peptidase n=1 Tax=Aestuariivirga sp. TaxID=2650926 RepID=UPI0039E3FF3E
MCGLYSFRRSPEETRTLFNYLEEPDFPPRQYVTPGGPMAIVRQGRANRHFALVRWGFVPAWAKEVAPGKPLINARSETVLEKPTFRNAIRRRRCLIPADGFYEWEGDIPGKKKPYFIHRPDHGLMAFAGIWEHWLGADGSELETAAIITTEANALVATIHTRSPVVIRPEDFALWLDCTDEDAEKIVPLLKPAADDYFEMEPTVIARNAPPPKPKAPPPAAASGGGQMSLL